MNATTTVLQTDSLLFRPALPDDLERICTIIRQAQAQMRLRGSRQWQNGYPAAAHITDDIDRGYGHVLYVLTQDSSSLTGLSSSTANRPMPKSTARGSTKPHTSSCTVWPSHRRSKDRA